MAYAGSRAGLATAQAIVVAKLQACRHLLTAYHRARNRASSAHAANLRRVQLQLFARVNEARSAGSRRALFLAEARGARSYWQAIALLCRRGDGWRRVYPRAVDSLNVLLNTGYTLLARKAKEGLIRARIFPGIGVLHGEIPDALAYDLMECFRPVAVDAVLIPLFSRKKISEKRIGLVRVSSGVFVVVTSLERALSLPRAV